MSDGFLTSPTTSQVRSAKVSPAHYPSLSCLKLFLFISFPAGFFFPFSSLRYKRGGKYFDQKKMKKKETTQVIDGERHFKMDEASPTGITRGHIQCIQHILNIFISIHSLSNCFQKSCIILSNKR